MTKVCHLSSVHRRYDTRVFLKECMSLIKHGYEVHLVVADGKGYEDYNGVKIHDVGKVHGLLTRFTKTTKAVLNKGLDIDADIYHFHDPELIFVGGKLRKRGKKVIYDVHEDVPRQIFAKPNLPKLLMGSISFLVEKLENRMARKFSFIITATPHIKNRFLKVNKRTEVIHNYPSLSEYDEITTPWEKKEEAVCYIGGIYEVRGIYENIEALAKLSNKMILAGIFEPKEFQKKCENSEGWQYVDFVGFVNRKEMASILARSKAGLVTLHPTVNYIDSLPVKMFEYMASGIPVIASNFELWKTIVEGSQCGICVDPKNISEIANAIKSILDDDKASKQMGKNGRQAVLEKYNWDLEQKTLLEVYDYLKKETL